jgi:hypothetical protein
MIDTIPKVLELRAELLGLRSRAEQRDALALILGILLRPDRRHSGGRQPIRYDNVIFSLRFHDLILRVPNIKRVWGMVVVVGVYGETFGQ